MWRLQLGNFLTYGTYAARLVAKLDINKDGDVQLSEVLQVVQSDPPGSTADGQSHVYGPAGGSNSKPRPEGSVTLDEIREVCPDEIKVCEEHEPNCIDEIQQMLMGSLKGPKSTELQQVFNCWDEKDPGRNAPSKTEL